MARQTVHLHFRIFPEDHLWVGECIELGVSTSAETEDEAASGIDEATQLYLATLAEQGELGRVLQEHGVAIVPEDAPGVGRIEERTLALPTGAA
jgi:predicted RNase H-like HicB family nuclease